MVAGQEDCLLHSKGACKELDTTVAARQRQSLEPASFSSLRPTSSLPLPQASPALAPSLVLSLGLILLWPHPSSAAAPQTLERPSFWGPSSCFPQCLSSCVAFYGIASGLNLTLSLTPLLSADHRWVPPPFMRSFPEHMTVR